MKYGQQGKKLLDLAPYVNETYMPNLTKLYGKNPEWENTVMNNDGQTYSLGYINARL